MIISIIVPIYNMENVLEHCIKSLQPISFTDYEIILVDDGSTDNSPVMIDKYAKENSHIKVIHKPNGGLSSARNAGMDIAKGTYISFVDPDDYVENGYIDEFYKKCLSDADIIVGGVKELILKNNKQICFNYKDIFFSSISSQQAQRYIKESDLLKSCFMHAKFIRKDILDKNKLRFKDVSPTEDTIFLFEYLIYSASICFTSYQGYNYIIHPRQSLSQKLPHYTVSLKISNYLWDIHQILFKKYNLIDLKYKDEVISEYGFGQRIVALIDLYYNKRLIRKERLSLLEKERKEYLKWANIFTFRSTHKKQNYIFKLIKSKLSLSLIDTIIKLFYNIKKYKL